MLKKNSYEAICNLDDDERYVKDKFNAGQIMRECFQRLDECSKLVGLLDTDGVSQGLTLELGYAMAKKIPISLIVRKDYAEKYDTIIRLADKVTLVSEMDLLKPDSSWI